MPTSIERHMLAMGFKESRAYFDWCWANGFDGSFDKNGGDLLEETEAFAALAAKREKHNRLHKNPKAFLEAVCKGELTSAEIARPNFKRTAAEIEASNESEEIRQSLLQMLVALLKHGDLAFQAAAGDTPYIRGLIKMHDRKALWLRPLEDWKPKSKNLERRFGELARHLFDKYGDVPRFMESVWLRNDEPSWRYRDWFVHLGRGHNLRTAKTPVPLTKKMAHHFLKAPDDYNIEQAVRWGQLHALGAGENAITAIIATRLGRAFEHEAFWFTFLRFVADNPMLDPRQIGPVVDYLHNQKFEEVEIAIGPGEWRREPPPQPGLSLSGRTVVTLMRQVDEWHDSLGRLRDLPNVSYPPAEFGGITVEKQTKKKPIRWVIRQLRSAKDLQLESEELRHCVASYHWSCARGRCTIWNLSLYIGDKDFERRQTIEVNKNRTIVQCRGLANCAPRAEEWAIVTAWAREANLDIAPYLG